MKRKVKCPECGRIVGVVKKDDKLFIAKHKEHAKGKNHGQCEGGDRALEKKRYS